MIPILHHPAHLWVGDPLSLSQNIIATLQKMLCPHKGCSDCSICSTIVDRAHPWVTWIEPENTYTTDQIDEIIQKSTLQLDDNEFRFFIITASEALAAHAANRLLKTIEEPGKNYFFIFFTQNKDSILPTIQSRCLLHVFAHKNSQQHQHALLTPVMNLAFDRPGDYFSLLSSSQIKEQESHELFNVLLEHWSQKLKQAALEGDDAITITKIVEIIANHLKEPIMPGSSKIAWKNLYISLHHAVCSNQ
jgi:hypothetical protein